MDVTAPRELQVEPADRAVDPGVLAPRAGRGAGVQHRWKGGVDPDLEGFAAHRPAQAGGHVEGVERDDSPPLRFDQEDSGIIARLAHGEDARGIGGQELLRAEHAARQASPFWRFAHFSSQWMS